MLRASGSQLPAGAGREGAMSAEAAPPSASGALAPLLNRRLTPAPSAGSSRPNACAGRCRARLSPLLPALALLLAALSPFAAAPAQAQIPVWSATLTVDVNAASSKTVFSGCSDPAPDMDACSTALTDNDFVFNGTTYTIRSLYLYVGRFVIVDLDKAVPSAALTLHLGTTQFSGSNAERQIGFGVSDGRWVWRRGGVSWTDGQQVSVKLAWPARPGNLSVTRGNAKLDLSWRAPVDPAGTLTGYDVHYTSSAIVLNDAEAGSDASMAWVAVQRNGLVTSQSILSLDNDTVHRVRVRAKSSSGAGVWAFGRGKPTDKSGDATLSALTAASSTAENGPFTALALAPDFAAGTARYTAKVANARTHVKLTPTVADTGKATVKVGKRGSLTTVASASASDAIALDVGANAIDVQVTAEDGDTVKTYTVTVTRATPAPSTLTLSLSGLNTNIDNSATESVGTVGVSATLNQPAGPGGVVVALAAGGSSTATATEDYSLPAAFTIAEGQRSATRVVPIVDDEVDEDHETLVLTTTVSGLTVTGVTLTIIDNDTASVRVSESALAVTAGGTGRYRVWLATKPTGDVTVTPSSSAPGKATVSGAVTFTPRNWQEAQEITVTGVAAGTATVSHALRSADAKYGGGRLSVGTVAVTVTIEDDDGVAPPPPPPPPPPPQPPPQPPPPPSLDASLSALVLSAGSLDFAPQTTAYAVRVPFAVSSVTVTPTASDAGATVTVNGVEVSSGEASAPIALAAGATLIEVVVTAPGGASGTYIVTVTRAPAPEAAAAALAFLPSASGARQGFVRVVNTSDEAGTVRVHAVDDAGVEYAPVTLAIGAGEARHFNSGDLERGNAAKGLTGATGAGQGHWRLRFESALGLRVMGYVRTRDGFVTSMHETVAQTRSADGYRYEVVFFNPASNTSQASRLRVVNRSGAEAAVTITGTDDAGRAGEEAVTLTLPAGAARMLSALDLESGGDDFEGRLGDGTGKWRLSVASERPLGVMSLLASPTGHLTNLSTAPATRASGAALAFLPSASGARQGFVRVVNTSDEAGTVDVHAVDDAGEEYAPVMLSIEAGEARHFNSDDLERGNAAKGLTGGDGRGAGALAPALRERSWASGDGLPAHSGRVRDLDARDGGADALGGRLPLRGGVLQPREQHQPGEPAAGGEPLRRRGRGDHHRHRRRGPRGRGGGDAGAPRRGGAHALGLGPRIRRRRLRREARRRHGQVAAQRRLRAAAWRDEPAREPHRASHQPLHRAGGLALMRPRPVLACTRPRRGWGGSAHAAARPGDQGVGLIPAKNPPNGGRVMSGWANHIEAIKGTRRRIGRMWMRPCQSQARQNPVPALDTRIKT